jgi:hypothetical protein
MDGIATFVFGGANDRGDVEISTRALAVDHPCV